MLRVADICEFYSPTGGGVRAYVRHKLEHAARLGHDVTIVAPGGETGFEELAGGRVAWVKAPYLPFDRNYRMFWRATDVWRVLDHLQPDLVEGSSPWRGGWIAAQWPGPAPRVLFMHSDPIASYPHNLLGNLAGRHRVDAAFGWFWSYLRRLNARFDATVVTGAWLARRFSEFGLRNIEAVSMGVDRGTFMPAQRSSARRCAMLAQCGLDESATLLIAVGRHHPEKRLCFLIDAVSRAQRHKNIGLIIVGDGFIRPRVEARASRARHVHVAGQVNDRALVAQMMASADAFIHGCASETFGLAVAEAMCCGTAVIVPDEGGAAVLAGSGHPGIYRTGNVEAASEAILRMTETGNRGRADAVESAAARIGTTEQHFDRLFRLYERIAARSAMLAVATDQRTAMAPEPA